MKTYVHWQTGKILFNNDQIVHWVIHAATFSHCCCHWKWSFYGEFYTNRRFL